MRRVRIILATLLVAIGVGAAVPNVALAASAKDTVCTALGSDGGCTTDPHGSTNLNHVIAAIINILSWVVGVTAVIMIIIGGFRFVTAAGDTNNVASARNTIIYALVGLVIVAFAQGIVKFVLHKV